MSRDVRKILDTVKDLKLLRNVYRRLFSDPYHGLYTKRDLHYLIEDVEERLAELYDEMYNMAKTGDSAAIDGNNVLNFCGAKNNGKQ